MNTPIDGHSTSAVPGERVIDKPELPEGGLSTDNTVYTEVIMGTGQMKRGTFDKFEVLSDEGERIGGTDKHPTPMTYLAMATGF